MKVSECWRGYNCWAGVAAREWERPDDRTPLAQFFGITNLDLLMAIIKQTFPYNKSGSFDGNNKTIDRSVYITDILEL